MIITNYNSIEFEIKGKRILLDFSQTNNSDCACTPNQTTISEIILEEGLDKFILNVDPKKTKQDITLNCLNVEKTVLLEPIYIVNQDKPSIGSEYYLRFKNIGSQDILVVLPTSWGDYTCINSIDEFIIPSDAKFTREIYIQFFKNEAEVIVR